MKKAVFSYYKDWKQLVENALRSYIYNNPDYEGYIYHINDVFIQRPQAIVELFDKGYDIVVALDGDTFTITKCEEIENTEYEIHGSLNIPNLFTRQCNNISMSNGENISCLVTSDKYCNNGVFSFTTKRVAEEWKYLNHNDRHGFWDQDYLNFLIYCGKFKTNVLDHKDVCYNESGRDQWQRGELRIENSKVILNDGRELKILHWAGGSDKGHFTNDNQYLRCLPNGLGELCINILEKSKDIKLNYCGIKEYPDFINIDIDNNIIKDMILSSYSLNGLNDMEAIYYSFKQNSSIENILEIGTHRGSSAKSFAINFPNAKIYTIDIYKEMNINQDNPEAHHILTQSEVGIECRKENNIIQLYGNSNDYDYRITIFDAIFIDGNHSYDSISKDFYNIIYHIRLNTIITFHDVNNHLYHVGIMQFLSELKELGIIINKINNSNVAYIICDEHNLNIIKELNNGD